MLQFVTSLAASFMLVAATLAGPAYGREASTPAAYLVAEPAIAVWLPPQPTPGDLADDADLAEYFGSRTLAQAGSSTLSTAEADDVLSAPGVGYRFSHAAGVPIDEQHAGRLLALMAKTLEDSTAVLAPIKRDVADGGRVRPYVRFPDQSVCKHDFADGVWHLRKTGSYPSGHATYGWLWGLTLSNILPERGDAIMQRAFEFGQSRLVCGFHYPSDLTAGRLVASALFASLLADSQFRRDLHRARTELRISFGVARRNLKGWDR